MFNTDFRKIWYVYVRQTGQLRFFSHTYTKKGGRILVHPLYGFCILQNRNKITSVGFVLKHLPKGRTNKFKRLTVERCDMQTLQKMAFGQFCASLLR
jgi:hypothetical protein